MRVIDTVIYLFIYLFVEAAEASQDEPHRLNERLISTNLIHQSERASAGGPLRGQAHLGGVTFLDWQKKKKREEGQRRPALVVSRWRKVSWANFRRSLT